MRKTLRVNLDGLTEGKHACLNEECGSSDAMHYYEETNSAHCFSCNTTFVDSNGEKKQGGIKLSTEVKVISVEDRDRVMSLPKEGKGYRGIRDDIYAKFGFRHEYDSDGKLLAQYVPVTTNGKLSGYKVRRMPKEFFTIGSANKNSDFIGQYAFKDHTGTLLIVGGETKMAASYQILKDNNTANGGKWDEVAVVSLPLGESSLGRHIKAQWAFVNQFKKIVIAMDSDPAGEKAVQDAMENFPQGKTYIMKMRYKDSDVYLEKGKENEFSRDFWSAKQHITASVTVASEAYDEVIEYVSSDRYSLPPHERVLEEMLRGGYPTAGIVLQSASTSIGKSTFVNALTLHMLLVNNIKVCVLPFENSNGEYLTDLISTVRNTKVQYIQGKEDRIAFMQDVNSRKAHKLFCKDPITNEDRLFIMDVDLEVEELKSKIIEMIVIHGVKIFVFDPVSDFQDVIGIEEMGKFMAWMKQTFKRYSCLFILVSHIRKSSSGTKDASTGGDFSESDIMGSSTLVKSASVSLMFRRNKEAEDPVERNTTYRKVSKARGTGTTGQAGGVVYNQETHRLMDMDDYLNGDYTRYDEYYKKYYDYSNVVLD